MAIATSAAIALAVAASASAGATVYAAKKSGEASEHASDVQAQAGNDALKFQERQLQQRETQLAPYIGSGQASLAKINELMGLPAYQAPVPNIKGKDTATAPNGYTISGLTSAAMGPRPTPYGTPSPTTTAIDPTVIGVPFGAAPRGSQPQTSPGAPMVGQPQVGERRIVQGQQAEWDGRGWKAAS